MNEIVVAFPGQGSQYDGMGKSWFDENESVRARFAEASELLGYSLEKLCFRGDPGELTRTHHAQASIFVLSYAMYEVLQAAGPFTVDYMTGHSLGELTALAAAGAITFPEAVRLVQVRGEAMEECAQSTRTGMVAVLGLSPEEVESLVAEFNREGSHIQVANDNSDQQTVLGGTLEEIEAFSELLNERGHRYARLNVAGAFHSSHMSAAVPAFTAAIEATNIVMPSVPVVSSITGTVYQSVEEIRNALATQITNPVRWRSVMETLQTRDVRLWIESGPKQVLTKMIKGGAIEAEALSLEQEPAEVRAAIERVLARRREEPSFVGLCLGAVAATRNRNFDDAEYTTGVLAPHRELQQLAARHEDPRAFTVEEEDVALGLLRRILQTKGVPVEEQEARIVRIIQRAGSKRRQTLNA